MNADPLEWLYALDQFGIKFGLENIQTVVNALGHPERSFQSIHIAGTNGKGSVTAMVAAACTAAGHRTARYTSPHLVDLSERFVIDGKPVDEASMRQAIQDVRLVIERLRAEDRLIVQPTFFEVTTAVGFELFRRAGAEVAVCEVGLGGRLDATNVLQPVATAITSIGFDHQQYLGTTLREIAREKAGIIKRGIPAVAGPMPDEALEEIAVVAAREGAPLSVVGHADVRPDADSGRPSLERDLNPAVRLRSPLHDYGPVKLSLPGAHQIANAHVAVRLLEQAAATGLRVPPEAIVHGLEHAEWPGRLELRRFPDGRELLIDAAHNPDGAAALARYLRESRWPRVPIVFGAMRDKDTAGMLSELGTVASMFAFTRAATSRSADPNELARQVQSLGSSLPVVVEPNPVEALALAWNRSTRIVAGGSIFLIGEILKALDEA